MKALIKNGTIIDPVYNVKEKKDILIENQNVVSIKKNIKEEVNYVIDASDMIVAPGFVDLHANFCDPGATDREDLKTGSLAAAKGGYTHVVLGVDNKPAPSESNVIDYINKYKNIMPINIYPSAAISIDRQGLEIADINFLYNHGAYAFYDGLKPILDKNLLEKAITLTKAKGKFVSVYSEQTDSTRVRGILEGSVSKKLGIKNATLVDAEATDLQDNIAIMRLTNAMLDFAFVTSKESIDIIKDAKKEKLTLFAEVPALNLYLSDKAIEKYGAYAKVLPPLRPEADRVALCNALKKDIIDIISSNHVPIEEKEKEGKFKDAQSGAIGLETVLGICGEKLVGGGYLTWKDVIEKISVNPAKLYGLDKLGAGMIDIDKPANITIFDPKEKWKLKPTNIVSKSHNTPLIDEPLTGKVKYTICNGRLVYRDVSIDEDKE